MGAIPQAWWNTEPDPKAPRHSPGEWVALRELWGGRVWFARPAIVVEDAGELMTFYIPSGVRCRQPVDDGGTYLHSYAADWTLAESVWEGSWVLSFAFPDTPYAVILGFDEATGAFQNYYVNLQAPLRRSPVGFDTIEFLLDVRIDRDRASWSWKDEEELQEAVAHGLFTEDDAAWFRHWGERAVEHVLLKEPPFDADWEQWRPDEAWAVPELPVGWELAPI